jgi:hypothetical protein
MGRKEVVMVEFITRFVPVIVGVIFGLTIGTYLIFLLIEYGYLTYKVNPPDVKTHVTWTFDPKRGRK